MKRAGVAGFFLLLLLLAGYFFFRDRGSQKEAALEPSSVELVHQPEIAILEVFSGRILSINAKEQVLMLDHGMKVFPLHWGKETSITIANHPVTASALVPGASVTVQCQTKNEQEYARSIQILPVRK